MIEYVRPLQDAEITFTLPISSALYEEFAKEAPGAGRVFDVYLVPSYGRLKYWMRKLAHLLWGWRGFPDPSDPVKTYSIRSTRIETIFNQHSCEVNVRGFLIDNR